MKREERNKLWAELRAKIWTERKHECEVCGDYLGMIPIPHFFSHIISKGAEPKSVLDPDNIALKCVNCHHQWEFGSRENPKFDGIKKKHEELREKYNRMYR